MNMHQHSALVSEIEMIKIIWLIERFYSMKFFRIEGPKVFPSFALLARSMLPRFSNNGFQECVILTACNFMSTKQCYMDFDHFEKRTLEILCDKMGAKGGCSGVW